MAGQFFDKLADFIMKNAKLIVAIWIVLLLVSVPFIMRSNSVLQYDMSKMSSGSMESTKGVEMLDSGYFNSGGGLSAGTIILVEAKDSLAQTITSELTPDLENKFYFWSLNESLREKYGLDCEITVKKLGRFDDKYFADKDTQMIVYVVNYPDNPEVQEMKKSDNIPAIRSIVSACTGDVDGIVGTYVTGTDAISYDTSSGSTHDIKHIDPISILLVLILIGLFFRSLVTAGTPPVVIGMAYGILLALVYGIGSVVGIYYITTILVLVSMLGAGCDYCIFIVSRYREELKDGKGHEEALRESIKWAGESIITSGISVIIGFGSLMLCSFSLVSTMGMVLALGIVLALLAALTFIPSLLMIVGQRIFWPSTVETYKEGSKAMKGWYGKCAAFGHKYFTHSAETAIKHAKVIFVVALMLTVPLAYVALSSHSSYDMISAMPPGEAKDGVAIISNNIGGGMLMPTSITMKVDAFVDININNDLQSGSVIPMGGTAILTATPKTGYMVKGWIVNGTYYTHGIVMSGLTISSDNTQCTLSTPITDDSVNAEAVYGKVMYSVEFGADDPALGNVTAKANGTTAVSGMEYPFGTKLTFTATPAEGNCLDYWSVDRNGDVEILYPDDANDRELSIDRASYDYVVTANFGPARTNTYGFTYSSDGNGTVAARADGVLFDSGTQVLERSRIVLKAIPNDGYEVKRWVINGVEHLGPVCTIDELSENTTATVEFQEHHLGSFTVTFNSTDENLGTVTATTNGTEIHSGDVVPERSNIVITATPKGDNVVKSWIYHIVYESTPIDVPTFIDKKEHVITSLSSNQNLSVEFGPKTDATVTVTATDPASNGHIAVLMNGEKLENTSNVAVGSDVSFVARVDSGYYVKNWVVDGVDVETTAATLTLYDLKADTTVTFVTAVEKFVSLTFGSNDDSLGTIKADCQEISEEYVERANAASVYNKMNTFAQSLMATTTDGKKNIAMAIGPLNGDILFDGDHEWVFDTVWNILPDEYRSILPSGTTYDVLIHVWKDVLPYELKQKFNYFLTYKAGFVSEPFTDIDNGQEYQYVKFMVVTKDEPMSALSVDTIKQVYSMKDDFIAENSVDNGGFVYYGYLSGAAVSNYEMSELVNKDFKFIIVVVVILLILLLFIVMRSYLTPIRAVLTIIMSVLWTLGLTYIIFEHLLGMPVVWVVPIVLFVVCLGLGMDYDILLTTRIKEYVIKGHTNDEAIVHAVQMSGAVITLCGLIMAGAFGTMMVSTSPMLKEFGFALGFAIAADALIIRTYIVPAIMHLLGDWNWKGPNGALKARLAWKKDEE